MTPASGKQVTAARARLQAVPAPATRSPDPVLAIRGLVTEFVTGGGIVRALDGIDLTVSAGETLGIVGESGSGKSVTVLSALRLLPEPPARIVGGTVHLAGTDIFAATRSQLRAIRGKDVGFVFQDALSALNPVITIGKQIVETIRTHDRSVSTREATERGAEILERVGLRNPRHCLRQYPHELSGGMRQRVLIAIAIVNKPKLIIADEPTTALDVTVQAQILALLREVIDEVGASLLLITHDLGVIAEMADRVAVMYAGKVVETAPIEQLFHAPGHPYTLGLLRTRPRLSNPARLVPIPGQPVSLADLPSGCRFHPRCSWKRDVCSTTEPELLQIDPVHAAACHYTAEIQAATWPTDPVEGA